MKRFLLSSAVMLTVGLAAVILTSLACRGDEPLVPVPDVISTPPRIILPMIDDGTPGPDVPPDPSPRPQPRLVESIAVGELYLIEFPDEPWRVLDSRRGVVTITQKSGPREFYARFADSKVDRLQEEDRLVTSPRMAVVKGLVPGQIELILVPPGDGPEQRLPLTVTAANPPPAPEPVLNDVLGKCHQADRKSQVEILRALAAKNLPRDPAGLMAAKDFVNAERIRRRTEDWIQYTDAVAEAIFGGKLIELADTLEGKTP